MKPVKAIISRAINPVSTFLLVKYFNASNTDLDNYLDENGYTDRSTITLDIIKEKYGFDKESIKMYFHYSPSTYLLHVHFLHIKNTECHSSVEYSHGLNSVIANLEIKSDYYQNVVIYKRVD